MPQTIRPMLLLAALAPLIAVADDQFAAEVYRDAAITIHAGLAGDSLNTVQFGDVLTLVIAVDYDPSLVSLPADDDALFDDIWPDAAAVAVRDRRVERSLIAGGDRRELRASLQFQVLGCPREQVTCPDDRRYLLPEFTLAYDDLHAASGTDPAASLTFQPWPAALTVATTLARDEDNQLYAFASYFPTGGYPDPLTGQDRSRSYLLLAGIALLVLLGGLFMWPFSSKGKKEAVAAAPRWQTLLLKIREDKADNEGRYLDSLRRCLVWYCNDELHIDPFVWLDLAERGDEASVDPADDKAFAELRKLFVELLHNPAGRGPELLARLEGLTRAARSA